MRYLKTEKMKILMGLFVLFTLFHVYKFLKVRITNLDLPQGKIIFYSPIDGDYEVYAMAINGTGVRQLTKNSATSRDSALDGEPSFSPDGKRIVFTSGRQGQDTEFIYGYQGKAIGTGSSKTGTSDIYIMDSDGRNQIPLTYQGLNLDPFFSPDGRIILFEAGGGREWQTRMININGGSPRILNTRPGHYWFSPDGKKIFDTFQCDLSVMDLDGANRSRLTNLLISEERKRDPRERSLVIYDLAFSGHGEKIAFVLKEDGGLYPNGFYNITRFYTMNIDGSDLREVHKIDYLHLDWQYISDNYERGRYSDIKQLEYSPDGQSIIFIADLTYKRGIFRLNLEDGSIKELTYRKKIWRGILDFALTPDGQRIVFVADIYPRNYALRATIFRDIRAYINYYLFRKSTPFYDNKYLCIMDIDGKNYRRIAKLPEGTELGRDFIHWEK